LQQDKFWKDQVQQINVVGKNEIELIPSLGNHIIILGTLENYQQKMNKLMKLYQDGLNVFGWNQYSTINLAYKNQIICTKKILP
jgi:cell division protein FtsQ